MRCDAVQAELSSRLDLDTDDGSASVDSHVAGCAECQSFESTALAVRRRLRYEAVGAVPDVAGRVLAALPAADDAGPTPVRKPARARWAPVAAALVAGMVAGGVLAGGPATRPPVAEAGLPARVLAAQDGITSLVAGLTVTERGWHPDVPERRFTGHLAYRAPEALALALRDRTPYPSSEWVANDVDLVVTPVRWWTQGPRACPVTALPGCTPPQPRVRAVEGREPFSVGAPAPLDLVVPVRSFAGASAPAGLGTRTIAGRTARGVVVTAAQAAPLLDAVRPAGNLRAVHPADNVRLWLDDRTLVPLRFEVVASSGLDRRRWGAAQGYRDKAGDVVLEVELRSVLVNGPVADEDFLPPPPGAYTTPGGFVEGEGRSRPDGLPPRFRLWRSGRTTAPGAPAVDVSAWTDGREWITVRTTVAWPGPGLFGDLGPVVRPVRLGTAGVGYAAEDGASVAVHGAGVDHVVAGSAPPAVLRAVAASIGTVGQPAPAGWPEAATITTAEAARRGLSPLVLPARSGFGAPALRADGGTLTVAYAGPGERAFVLVASPAPRLAPPLDPDARAVAVRGTIGRYSPGRGELEWVEGARAFSLRSATIGAGELVALAGRLGAP